LKSSFIPTIIRRLLLGQQTRENAYQSIDIVGSECTSNHQRLNRCSAASVSYQTTSLNMRAGAMLTVKQKFTWNCELELEKVALLPSSLGLASCLPFGNPLFIVKRITTPSFLGCCLAQTVSTLLLIEDQSLTLEEFVQASAIVNDRAYGASKRPTLIMVLQTCSRQQTSSTEVEGTTQSETLQTAQLVSTELLSVLDLKRNLLQDSVDNDRPREYCFPGDPSGV
ncbi:hypothetical protein KCU67_g105, partial [Aureobasidium melanogenum]